MNGLEFCITINFFYKVFKVQFQNPGASAAQAVAAYNPKSPAGWCNASFM